MNKILLLVIGLCLLSYNAIGQLNTYYISNDSIIEFLPICKTNNCIEISYNEKIEINSVFNSILQKNNIDTIVLFTIRVWFHIHINEKGNMECYKIISNIEIDDNTILEINEIFSKIKHNCEERCKFIIPLEVKK